MLQHILQFPGTGVSFAQQEQQHSGIEIARPRAHDDAAGGRHAHAGIDRATVAHGGEAGTAAQVRDDQSCRHILHLRQNRFARQPVKSIALHALGQQLMRQRKHACRIGQMAMERGIETGHLACLRQGPGRMPDPLERCWNMQRRETGGRLDLLHHRLVDQAMLTQPRTAVHDAMGDGIDGRIPGELLQGIQRGGIAIPAQRVSNGLAILLIAKLPVFAPHIYLTFRHRARVASVHPIDAELERRGADIQAQHLHAGCHCQSRTSGRSMPCSLTYSRCRSMSLE